MSNVGVFYGLKFSPEESPVFLDRFVNHLVSTGLGTVEDIEGFKVAPDGSCIQWSDFAFSGLEKVRFEFVGENDKRGLIVYVEPLHHILEGEFVGPTPFPGLGTEGWGVMEIFAALFECDIPEWFVYKTPTDNTAVKDFTEMVGSSR